MFFASFCRDFLLSLPIGSVKFCRGNVECLTAESLTVTDDQTFIIYLLLRAASVMTGVAMSDQF